MAGAPPWGARSRHAASRDKPRPVHITLIATGTCRVYNSVVVAIQVRRITVVNGVKQRARFGWYSHLCTANGPSAKAMGTHGPLDPAAPEGKAGAARDGPREACLVSADPWDTGR